MTSWSFAVVKRPPKAIFVVSERKSAITSLFVVRFSSNHLLNFQKEEEKNPRPSEKDRETTTWSFAVVKRPYGHFWWSLNLKVQ